MFKIILLSFVSMLVLYFVKSDQGLVTGSKINNEILTNIENQIGELKIKNGYLQKRIAEFKSNYFNILQQENLNATIDLFEEEHELDPYGVAILSEIEQSLWFLRQTSSFEQLKHSEEQTEFKSILLKLCNSTCISQQNLFDKGIQALHDDLQNQLDSLGTQSTNNTKVVLVQIARTSNITQESLQQIINNPQSNLEDMRNGINKKLEEIQSSQLTKLNDLTMQMKKIEYPGMPKSCAEAVGNYSISGIYKVLLSTDLRSVYCDKNGWLLIQRQFDGPLSFNRGWLDYRNGFGDPNGQYWLGLETLREITMQKSHELFILMTDFENIETFARYDNFLIGSEAERYKLKTLGTFAGNDTTDRLKFHLNMNFTTFDSDNDLSNTNCAIIYGSGWWYEKCFWTNLNQNIWKNSTANLDMGLYWKYHVPLKQVSTFIRLKGCTK